MIQVIHRDFYGDHDTEGESCWCGPTVVDTDDLREPEQISQETLERLDG